MSARRSWSRVACLAVLLSPGAGAQGFCPGDHALRFDGINDRVTIPYDASFPGAVFTVAAWIRSDLPVGPSRESIVARGEDDLTFDGPWFLMMDNQGQLVVQIENNVGPGQNAFYSSGTLVDDGHWHHVAATRELGGTLVFYVDGAAVATFANTLTPSPDNRQVLTIGCTHGTIGTPPPTGEPPIMFFDGVIEEPAMWVAALSAGQIHDVFKDGVDPGSTGLVGYWKLDEGAGQHVLDLSPAGNHGVLGEASGAESIDPAWVVAPTHCTYGCGLNPQSSLAPIGGQPSVGTSIALGLHNPLGTQGAGAVPLLAVSLAPGAAPCGLPIPGLGMAGGGSDGELLVSLAPGDFQFVVAGSPWGGAGTFAVVPLTIPSSASLVGLSVYTQGALSDLGAGADPAIGLTTPLELVLGP